MKNERLVSLKRRGKTATSWRQHNTRTVCFRHCCTSRYIFHLVRQISLWNSEPREKGSCSGQTGASVQNSSVANQCQNSRKSKTARLLNHMQEGRPSRDKLGIPQNTRFFFFLRKLLHRQFSVWPQSKLQCSMQTLVVHLRHVAVGRGTVLQAGRPRVRFLMG